MSEIERKPILYSAVQPSGVLTIGNYIGALRNFKLLSDDYDCLFCMADLHALTVRQVPAELRRHTAEVAALYIACGLDPEKNIIYAQSHVHQHAELAWILNCFTYDGELRRMTQFKDKSARHADNINAGLLTYPVLMAADILLYQTAVVPVGADQKQHLELSRDIAERFNSLYGDVFVVPEPYISKSAGARVMSLTDPTAKMSKSGEPDSFISMVDDADAIRRKIRRAVTDSDGEIRVDAENKPGVTNLITITAAMSGRTPDEVCASLQGQGYGALKDAATQAIIDTLSPIQSEYKRLVADKAFIAETLKNGAERASALANRTLRKVYKKVGLYQL
ncbi:MAG: tryptophan--tRNA ligase [Clostridia bacterium]|nr:tryptophan--tRNA ligase [Clostridia bacterium]